MSNSVSLTTPESTPPDSPSKRKKGGGKGRVRATPKGRRVDPKALAEVQALLGDEPRRRDLLIEHLHKIQDRYGCISAQHLVALAEELQKGSGEDRYGIT